MFVGGGNIQSYNRGINFQKIVSKCLWEEEISNLTIEE